jgi:hypothetical protein
MITKFLAAFATAAVLAAGTLATTGAAQAGGYGYGHGHGHGYGHVKIYTPSYGYGHHNYGYVKTYEPSYYEPTCFYKQVQVWTEYGPEWINKKVCH